MLVASRSRVEIVLSAQAPCSKRAKRVDSHWMASLSAAMLRAIVICDITVELALEPRRRAHRHRHP